MNYLLVASDQEEVARVRAGFADAGVTSPLHVATTGTEADALVRTTLAGRRHVVLVALDAAGLAWLRTLRADPVLRKTVVVGLARDAAGSADAVVLHCAGVLAMPEAPAARADALAIVHRYWQRMEMP